MAQSVNRIRTLRALMRRMEGWSPLSPMLSCEIGDAQRGARSGVAKRLARHVH
jgi:hypothetical protein